MDSYNVMVEVAPFDKVYLQNKIIFKKVYCFVIKTGNFKEDVMGKKRKENYVVNVNHLQAKEEITLENFNFLEKENCINVEGKFTV